MQYTTYCMSSFLNNILKIENTAFLYLPDMLKQWRNQVYNFRQRHNAGIT